MALFNNSKSQNKGCLLGITYSQFAGFLQFSEQSVSTSLHLISLSLTSMTDSGSLFWSLHANYCNQTQVFIILQLTYLLTARLLMLSPTADFAELRPPRHRRGGRGG